MTNSWALFLLAVSIFLLNGHNGALAQQEAEASGDNESIDLNLEQVDLRVLINMTSEVTGKNFIVDPRVKGKVSIVSGGSLNKEQLYDVFLSVLDVNNFAAVESGNVVKIIPRNLVKQKSIPTRFNQSQQEVNDQSVPEEQVTQIIQLQYAPVQDLVPVIRPLVPPSSHFAPHVPSNSIILTDVGSNIQRVLEIVRRLDIPDKRSNLRVIYLNHTKASDLSGTIQSVFSAEKDAQKPNDDAITVQALAAVNALVISAPDEIFTKIQALVEQLDIERSIASDVSVIALKHAKAPDLVEILNDTSKAADGVAQEFSVQADVATNSLIVRASGRKLKDMQGVIKQLDVRREQVFVEAIIAEVSLDQITNLGLEWQVGDAENPVNIVNDATRTAVGAITGGTDFNLQASGFNYSLLDFRKYNLDVLLNALRSDVNTNVLSTPTILTLENEEAEIVVGQEVPFITGRYDNSGTSGNSNQFQTIERKDVGIKLKIKAQINEGNTIRLDVGQEISSVNTATIQGQADLITNQRSIDAVVEVDDGQVVVLGGLIQDDYVDREEWVPILGKIPLIGYLFRNKSKTAVQRNLMVFLKPNIIRSPEELVGFSKNKYDNIRNAGIEQRKEANRDVLVNGKGVPLLNSYENAVESDQIRDKKSKSKITSSSKLKKDIDDEEED